MASPRPKLAETENRRSLAEIAARPVRLTSQQAKRLDALSQDDVDAAADADPVAPTWSDAMMDRAVFARAVRRARQVSGLSQVEFAATYRIGLGRLRNWEQARTAPDSVGVAYVRTILHAPNMVATALADHKVPAG